MATNKPSQEAVEAAKQAYYYGNFSIVKILEAAYAIDVTPLQQKIEALDKENEHLALRLRIKAQRIADLEEEVKEILRYRHSEEVY